MGKELTMAKVTITNPAPYRRKAHCMDGRTRRRCRVCGATIYGRNAGICRECLAVVGGTKKDEVRDEQ